MDHSTAMTEKEAGRLNLVHRAGAALIALVIIAFGVVGLVGGLGFFETEGTPVAGLNSNGLLSVVSLVTGAVLIIAAARGGRTASSVTAVIGGLFVLSGLVNLALLETSFNILAFEIPNVFFSLVVGVLLLTLGLYGRVSGGLSVSNPYRREREERQRGNRGTSEGTTGTGGDELDDSEEHLAEVEEMARIEVRVAENRATPDELRTYEADRRRRAAAERERAYRHARETGQGTPQQG